jgi:hypothetical protein
MRGDECDKEDRGVGATNEFDVIIRNGLCGVGGGLVNETEDETGFENETCFFVGVVDMIGGVRDKETVDVEGTGIECVIEGEASR